MGIGFDGLVEPTGCCFKPSTAPTVSLSDRCYSAAPTPPGEEDGGCAETLRVIIGIPTWAADEAPTGPLGGTPNVGADVGRDSIILAERTSPSLSWRF